MSLNYAVIFAALRNCVSLLLFMGMLATASFALAHGNDDHEHTPAQSTTTAAMVAKLAPRASAQTEELELLAVLQGRHLIIYLDRFADNTALSDAQIELEISGILKTSAKPASSGVYVIDLAAGVLEKAGKYPLLFSVQNGEFSDVMTTTLEVSDASTSEQVANSVVDPAHSGLLAHPWRWLGLMVALCMSGFAVWRFRQTSKQTDADSLNSTGSGGFKG